MTDVPSEPDRPSDDRIVIVDACTWQNFAVVDGLWVLKGRYAGVLRWTEAIRYELTRGVRAEPKLQQVLDQEADWLGTPIRLDQPGDLQGVDLIRRGLGGYGSEPLRHLGEAESIHALEHEPRRRPTFITDDVPAAEFVRHRPSNIQVLDSAAVLAEAFAMGEIGCPDAYDMLKAMWNYPPAPRSVRLPPHHEVC